MQAELGAHLGVDWQTRLPLVEVDGVEGAEGALHGEQPERHPHVEPLGVSWPA